jgi:hypothetical protein
MQLNARFRLADYGAKLQKPAKDVYLGLRNLALRIAREKTGLVATFVPTEPWGVVIMDWVVSQVTATVIASSNRHAVGLSAAVNPMNLAQCSQENGRRYRRRQPLTHATSEYPLPQQQGEVFFYLFSDAGIFTASASKEDLSSHHHPLSKLIQRNK